MLINLLLLSPLPLFAFAYWSVLDRMVSEGLAKHRAEQAIVLGGAVLYLLVLQQSADGWVRWVPLVFAVLVICVGAVAAVAQIATHARR